MTGAPLFGDNKMICPKCLGTGEARDLHTSTVEGAAAAERFYGGHNRPVCGKCNGTGTINNRRTQ